VPKLPFLQLFVDDWLAEERLRICSLAARGLWIDMLCLMHKNTRRGFLGQANGQPMTAEQLSRLTGCSPAEVAHLSQELLTAGVASANEQGMVFSRRMVRDEEIRQVRQSAGKKGAEATNRLPRQKSGKPPGKPLEYGSGSELKTDNDSVLNSAETPEQLGALWCFFAQSARALGSDERDGNAAMYFAELHRNGLAIEAMRLEIVSDKRKRTEKLWDFEKRMSPKPNGKPSVFTGLAEFLERGDQ